MKLTNQFPGKWQLKGLNINFVRCRRFCLRVLAKFTVPCEMNPNGQTELAILIAITFNELVSA